MIKNIEEGYIAITEDKKMLKNYWSGGAQTGTNKQSLTTNIEDATITDNLNTLNMYIEWYNKDHARKVVFTIKRARRTRTIELQIL